MSAFFTRLVLDKHSERGKSQGLRHCPCGPLCSLWRGLFLFAAEDARDAAYNAAHGQLAFSIVKENLSNPASAIVPALQNRNVFHSLQRRFHIGWRKRPKKFLYPPFH